MPLLLNMNKMKIQWAAEARSRWRETALYIYQEWGSVSLRKFKNSTEDWQDKLESFPEIGSIEPLLIGKQHPYRSVLISTYNKIIYYIDNDTIYIVDFWDTRREPNSQANKLK